MVSTYDPIASLNEQIKGIEVAMLTTVYPDSTLHSCPMVAQPAGADGVMWFLTGSNTDKVEAIHTSQRMNLAFSDPVGQRYISVSGYCELVRDHVKSRSHDFSMVTMRHPDIESLRQTVEQRRFGDDFDLGMTVLARGCRSHATTEVVHHDLQAVADAERRQTGFEHLCVSLRRALVVDARGSAREDDALGLQLQQALDRRGARKHHRKHVQLANSASDELCVLRSEVQNDDS